MVDGRWLMRDVCRVPVREFWCVGSVMYVVLWAPLAQYGYRASVRSVYDTPAAKTVSKKLHRSAQEVLARILTKIAHWLF